MKVYSQLEEAQIEQLAADPLTPVEGRIWHNTTADQFKVKINGSSVITGPLKFNAIGSPSYSPWAFNGAIVIGTYTLHFAPTGGTAFNFSFTTTVVDPFSQALAFVAAFNADATVIANGFRAYGLMELI